MLEQDLDDGVGVGQIGADEARFGEGWVPANHLARWAVDRGEDVEQVVPVEGGLQVLDDVELDATLLEQAEGATGLPSAGVVDEQESAGIEGAHGRRPYRAGLRSSGPEVVESSE